MNERPGFIFLPFPCPSCASYSHTLAECSYLHLPPLTDDETSEDPSCEE